MITFLILPSDCPRRNVYELKEERIRVCKGNSASLVRDPKTLISNHPLTISFAHGAGDELIVVDLVALSGNNPVASLLMSAGGLPIIHLKLLVYIDGVKLIG